MSLLAFFQWCEQSGIGDAIRRSSWLFPFIEAIHLLGLGVIGGAVLVVDLRLLGLGLSRQSAAQLTRDAQPWLLGSLLLMIVTGGLLFLSEAIKCYYHEAFWFKMSSLLLAILFTFTIQRKVTMADESRIRPLWYKVVAVVSVLLWSGVGIGGRWIGFS
ncbi:MAG TPA: DUF6644 family protein [Candidatus Acidoferrales bacterium]|jgi:uncharacterized membrane protein YhdT|nr:DUF6644 family protein [Candidatus Acidoferrales bacterium]